MLSTHSPTACGGEGGGASHQRGVRFSLARKGGLPVFHREKPGFKGFIILAAQPPTTTLAPKGETTHYDLCIALLLQIMFAVHAEGVSNFSPFRTFGPKGCQPSRPTGRVIQRAFFLFYHIYKHKRTAAVQAAVLFVRFLTWRRKYPPPHHIPHPSAVRRPLRRFRPCRFWRG